MKVYDSVFDAVDDHMSLLIRDLFGSLAKPTVVVIPKQLGANDCGLYAIVENDPAALHFIH